jgi:2',3'-cyclic-nucleotide 2'-phosphodiesterase/3'-nucleotidase
MQDYHWDIYKGIDYTIDITKPVGQRVTRLLLQGKEIQPEKVLPVALNSYRALGGGEFSMFTEGKVLDKSKQEIRELIAEYLSKKKTIHPQDYEDDNLKIEPDIYNYYLR